MPMEMKCSRIPRSRFARRTSIGPTLALLSAPLFAGLTPARNQIWRQGTVDAQGAIVGASEPGEYFGTALATGDFNHDGFPDLAIGSPGENDESTQDHGVVNVIYGGPSGLSTVGNQQFQQGVAGIPGSAEENDYFGSSLASGRFDSDLYEDLAIGIPFEGVNGQSGAGAVVVIYGAATGLQPSSAELWHQDSTDVLDTPEAGDKFGTALASGDFDYDGLTDLAIGVPGESVGGAPGAGAVQIFFGTANGFDGGDEIWNQDNPIFGAAASDLGDNMGSSLAVGDFSNDGVADLAIGVIFDCPGAECGGSVLVIDFVFPGDPSGQYWHQDVDGVPGGVEEGEFFGWALAAGDFSGEGADDLAVGVPWESIGAVLQAGSVNIFYGDAGVGLVAAGSELWSQDSTGIAGTPDEDDNFGNSLAAGDFDGDGTSDLAIGIDGENIGATASAGAVVILKGVLFSGLSGAASEFWSQDSPGILGGAEEDDHFGNQLAAADFDGDGHADLAVGVPYEDQMGGAVNVLRGALFSDGFESQTTGSWSSSTGF